MKRKFLSTFIATTSIVGLMISSAACSSDTVDSAADTAAASIVSSSEYAPEVESSSQHNEPSISLEPKPTNDTADELPEGTNKYEEGPVPSERDESTADLTPASEEAITPTPVTDDADWDSSCPLTQTSESWDSAFDYYGASMSDRTWGTLTSMSIEDFDCFTRLMIVIDVDPDISDYGSGGVPTAVRQGTCMGVNETCPGSLTLAVESNLDPAASLQSDSNLFSVTQMDDRDNNEFTVQYDLQLDRNIVTRMYEKIVDGKEYLAIDFTDGRLS